MANVRKKLPMQEGLKQWQVSEATRMTLARAIERSIRVLKDESISAVKNTKYSIYFDTNKTTGGRSSKSLFAPHAQTRQPSDQELARIRKKVEQYCVLSRQELNVISYQVREYRKQGFFGKLWWRLFNDDPIDIYMQLDEIATLEELHETVLIDGVTGILEYKRSRLPEETGFWSRLTKGWRASLDDAYSLAASNVMRQAKDEIEQFHVTFKNSCSRLVKTVFNDSQSGLAELTREKNVLTEKMAGITSQCQRLLDKEQMSQIGKLIHSVGQRIDKEIKSFLAFCDTSNLIHEPERKRISNEMAERRLVVSDSLSVAIKNDRQEQSTLNPLELPQQMTELVQAINESIIRNKKNRTKSWDEQYDLYSRLLKLTKPWLEFVLWECGQDEFTKEKAQLEKQVEKVHIDLLKIYHPDINNNDASMSGLLNEQKDCFAKAVREIEQQSSRPEWLSNLSGSLSDERYKQALDKIEKFGKSLQKQNEEREKDINELEERLREVEVRLQQDCEEKMQECKKQESRLQQAFELMLEQEREERMQEQEENNKKFAHLFAMLQNNQGQNLHTMPTMKLVSVC